jgi:hypothetical protein
MARGSQTGRKVGGLVRFDDHDVAVDDLHFVGADRRFGRGCIQGSGAEVDPRGLKRAPDPAVLYIAVSQRASSLSGQALSMGHLFYVEEIRFAPSGLGRDRSA